MWDLPADAAIRREDTLNLEAKVSSLTRDINAGLASADSYSRSEKPAHSGGTLVSESWHVRRKDGSKQATVTFEVVRP